MYSIIVTLTFLCTEPPSEKTASTGNELIPSYKEMMGQIQVSYYYYHNIIHAIIIMNYFIVVQRKRRGC